jgi:photosystem II stability/assembly factor-like uncharacterized protein
MIMTMYLGMADTLLVVNQKNGGWQVEPRLNGLQVTCVAVDPFHPERVYCGSYRRGLWRSDDAGRSWLPIGDNEASMSSLSGGIRYTDILSVAVSASERAGEYGVIYAGTEPSAMYRSEDGGKSWQELEEFNKLPSSSTWSFPPKPTTHHVRWIAPDPLVAGRVFVAVEAGALVRTLDGGQTWEDRVPDGPFDTHTLMMHPKAPERLYSSAGDGFIQAGRGYNESRDGGKTWQHPDEGLHHHYLWGAAVDPGDPDTIVVSASHSPFQAHSPVEAASTIYQKTANSSWREVTQGLPPAQGTIIPVLASSTSEPGAFYLLSNRGCYRSADAGLTWEQLPLPWPDAYQHQHAQALVIAE